MASEPTPTRRLGPFGIALIVALLLVVLFWGFLCLQPAGDSLEGGSDIPATEELAE